MRRKLIVAVLAVVFLFTILVGTAFADEGALKTYLWPKKCNTAVLLYAHTWTNLTGGHIDGRMAMQEDCGFWISSVHVFSLRLFVNPSVPRQIGFQGDHVYFGFQANVTQTATTSDATCHNGPPNDTVWVNATYQITWFDGTATHVRSDNSRNWVPQPNEDCQ